MDEKRDGALGGVFYPWPEWISLHAGEADVEMTSPAAGGGRTTLSTGELGWGRTSLTVGK